MADTKRTRTRKKNTGVFGQTRLKRWYYPTGALTQNTVSNQLNLEVSETITDWTHPGYEKRISSGQIILGDLTLLKSWKESSEGSIGWRDASNQYLYDGHLYTAITGMTLPAAPSETSLIATVSAQAAVSALKKLNEAEVDAGEMLATLGQTVQMFRKPLSGMQDVLRRLEKTRANKLRRKGSGPSATDWSKATADTWLEQSFGWRSCFQDTFTVMSLFRDKRYQFESLRRVARGSAKGSVSTTSNPTSVNTGTSILSGLTATGTVIRKTEFKSSCGVMYQLPSPDSGEFYSRHLGFGANNLPTTVWNLTPYSWVVDQVIDVGGWLQAAMPSPGISEVFRWRTNVKTVSTSGSAALKIKRTPAGGSATWYHGSTGTYTNGSDSVIRVLTFDLPSSPIFNPYLGRLSQALNDVAFAYQLVHNALRRWSH